MAAKKKPTKKGGAAATSAANKTKARTRTVKGGKPTSGSPKVSSRPRKRAEEEIWMLKHSIDVYYDGAYWIDADNKFVYVNDAGCKALGYTREELIGTTIYEVNPKVNAERMKEVWALLRQGRSFSAESVHRRKDGSEFPVEVVNTYVRFGGKEYVYSFARDITERKRAEETLRESENRTRNIIEAIPVGMHMYRLEPDGRLVFIGANPAADRILGVDNSIFIGKTIEEAFPPLKETEVPKRYREVAASGKTWHDESIDYYEGVIQGAFEVHAFRTAPSNMVAAFEDITERKRAEKALGASQKLLETIIDTAPTCIKLITADGSLQKMNRAGLEMLDAESFDQVQGKCVYPLVSEEHREAFKTMTQEVFKGRSQTLEFKMIGLKGRARWLYTQAIPIRNEKGEVVLALATTIDITERKRAEEALHESERSLKTLMGNLPGMAYRCRNDRNWTMEYVSEGAAGLTGYQPADLIGNAKIAYNDLIHPDDQGQVWEAVQKAVGSRDKYTLNYRIRRADGQERWVWEQGQGVFSPTGDLLALEGFITDVSERCLLEEERLKTQKLESIGTLAGGIAHDFNNLLQGIFGYISMAKMSLDQKDKSLAMLEQSEKALHQSVNLTTQLLTFSKGGKPVKKSLSLLPVIENAARFALSGSRSEYRISSAPDLWRIEADEGQLGQVIQNIVLNADQAMPLGGCVEIAAQNVSASDASVPRSIAGQDHVLITIQDSGVGISEQYLGKIFDPYFTTKEKGSGLGLATSYSIIRNHGGLIDVRSQVGKGTAFFLYLPASEAVAEESPGAAAPGKARNGRVLVMDDEQVVREVTGELLRALGHEVEFAESGEAALTMYREAMAAARPFDIVILDLTIRGGMGGLETLGKLLEIDPGAKAVVSSGYSDEAALSNYRELGFRAFLKKPYNMDELQNTLSVLLG